MTLVVDSSVVLKWLIPEPDSDLAKALARRDEALIAPDLVVVETANAIWKKASRGEITTAEAATRSNIESFLQVVLPTPPLVEAALGLALAYHRTVYDSVYLALALAQDCHLVTADRRFVNLLRTTDLGALVLAMDEVE